MKDRNEENLRDLFAQFMDSEQANAAAEDIERGEELLAQWPAPEPSSELLSEIKVRMASRLANSGRRHIRWIASRVAGIAAAVVVVASVWTGFNKEVAPPVEAGLPTAIWESDNIAADDLNLASFKAEVERIEDELKSLLLEEGSSGESIINEAEFELRDIQGEFWKG
ncbi:MAG: hypothetical protein ACYS8Z_12530 [Planctomycetota bacterium]|jgi:hypothetical protein